MSIKLTVQQVMDAMVVLTTIIREKRPMPQAGKFRLARLHGKLAPEFAGADAQREALIKTYDYRVGDHFTVPEEKMPEFIAAWKSIGDQVIEVAVEPIPLSCIDLGYMSDGAIDADELIALGDLVGE